MSFSENNLRLRGRVGIAFTVGLALLIAGTAAVALLRPQVRLENGESSPTQHARGTVESLCDSVAQSLRLSRPVLLGSRDPVGPSCVAVVRAGDIQDKAPNNAGDWNGGPGTTFATLYGLDREQIRSPLQDLQWHQTRLRRFLENLHASNDPALATAREITARTRALRERLANTSIFPADLISSGYINRANWPGYCLTELDAAIARKDLASARHWTDELLTALFSMEDLHYWLKFLSENYLAALDFQAQCQTLYDQAEKLKKPYQPNSTVSNFPAGVLCLNGFGNFYEVERQGERLFSMPPDRVAEIATNQHLTSGSMWITPAVRRTFLMLQGALSADNQKTFDEAARTPYEHSYLINMLYRAEHSGSVDFLVGVLRKFDQLNPRASITELMGVLMYRGHSFAGLEWADRYQPELLDAASKISPSASNEEALLQATRWTNQFYRTPASYGVTFTLRDALEHKRLDCVRATDMIGAIFRNSGRPRFGNVRWVGATCGHSLAAHFVPGGDKFRVVLGDGLRQMDALEQWPDCYFNDHPWPPGFENEAPPYAAELYVRGIDSYVFAQAYIIRGPNAGELFSTEVPYTSSMRETSQKKVFAGPYPR